METQTTTSFEKKLFYEDVNAIAFANWEVPKEQAYYQQVVDTYSAIPNVDPITDEIFAQLFSLPTHVSDEAQQKYYDQKYWPLHEPLGITKEAGLLMVAHQLPDFSQLFAVLNNCNIGRTLPMSVFTINDGKVGIVQDELDSYIDRTFRVYIENETEAEYINNLTGFIDNLERLHSLLFSIPGLNGIADRDLDGNPTYIHFDRLGALLDVDYTRHLSLRNKPNVGAFKQFKQIVATNLK